MARFIDPRVDWAFKRIFGSEDTKECLITFLNGLFEDELVIKDVTFAKTEKLGLRPGDRGVVFDVYCVTNEGKHVIVEKPIATSIADAKAMNKVAKAKKLSLTVDHMMVNNPYNIAGKAAMKKLGTVNDSCFHMEFAYGYDPAEAATWRCSKVEEMGGPIGDVASHCFYVAEFMFGKKIKKVAAVYYPKVMSIKAEDGAYIKFFFEDGTQGSVNAAFSELRGGLAGTLTNLGYEIYGNKAALRGYGTMFQLSGYADEPIKQRIEIDDGKKVVAVKPGKIQNIYQTLIEGHAKSVVSGKLQNADDAIHNLALCAACHESAKKGGKIIAVKD